MKKHLLMPFIVFIAITAYGQNSVPNGGFESWNTYTYDYPENYPFISNSQNFFHYNLPPNVTKTTDAYHGLYAVELTTNASVTDTAPGYFVNGNPSDKDPSQWTGGVPYSQKPTGIKGYYKYNVATADSGTIIVAFSKAGINIGTYFFQLGGIHSSYTLFDFTFSPALSVTPDSVMFGAISCKISGGGGNGPQGPAGSTLQLDSISFTGVGSQPSLMNGDFESWQSQTLNSPADWYVQSDNGDGINRTNDAFAGNYAMELITHSDKTLARYSQVSTGYYPNNCHNNCYELGGYPFSNQKDTLVFYYKYIPSGNDSASINLNFKKNGSNYGMAGMNLPASATYQYTELPFNLWQAPDSVMIQIQSSLWKDTLLSYVGSDLKIDEIYFKSQGVTTGIFNYKKDNSINVFPNPTTGKIQISGANAQSVEIFNTMGGKIYSASNLMQQISNEIDLSAFPKGIYFVEIYNKGEIYSEKIILQ